MSTRSSLDPYGNSDVLSDQFIGEAYAAVKKVADSIANVNQVAEALGDQDFPDLATSVAEASASAIAADLAANIATEQAAIATDASAIAVSASDMAQAAANYGTLYAVANHADIATLVPAAALGESLCVWLDADTAKRGIYNCTATPNTFTKIADLPTTTAAASASAAATSASNAASSASAAAGAVTAEASAREAGDLPAWIRSDGRANCSSGTANVKTLSKAIRHIELRGAVDTAKTYRLTTFVKVTGGTNRIYIHDGTAIVCLLEGAAPQNMGSAGGDFIIVPPYNNSNIWAAMTVDWASLADATYISNVLDSSMIIDIKGRSAYDMRDPGVNSMWAPTTNFANGFLDQWLLDAQLVNLDPPSKFTGSIDTTTLTVTGTVTGNALVVGSSIVGPGILDGTKITALGTGTGGAGTYTINNNHASPVASQLMTAIGNRRYVFENIAYNVSTGRFLITIKEYTPDGLTGVRKLIFEDLSNHLMPDGGIETIALSSTNNSNMAGFLLVDWSKLPLISPYTSNASWTWSYLEASYAATKFTNAELNVRGVCKSILTEQRIIDITIDGINARIWLSDGYGRNGPDHLVLVCHGNSSNYTLGIDGPSDTAKAYMRANKISYAAITGQDSTSTGNTGWGNDTYRSRYVKLYNWLIRNMNFHRSVVVAGASMGGLCMGQLGYYKPFPITFLLGLGPVPSLRYMFDYGSNRKVPIRHAFGMDPGGADDANFDSITTGYDWFKMGNLDNTPTRKFGFPRMHLYVGTGDSTYTTEFGGDTNYHAIRDGIRASGGFCQYTKVSGVSHAASAIWDQIITDGVFSKELGII